MECISIPAQIKILKSPTQRVHQTLGLNHSTTGILFIVIAEQVIINTLLQVPSLPAWYMLSEKIPLSQRTIGQRASRNVERFPLRPTCRIFRISSLHTVGFICIKEDSCSEFLLHETLSYLAHQPDEVIHSGIMFAKPRLRAKYSITNRHNHGDKWSIYPNIP